ncbi:MAG: esterase family protein [Muribaculaceae bacterium]|nr:esterase family protein [Muribaculaceae bacterium]
MSSDMLGVQKVFLVYLPEDYDEAVERRYPVLYLFHQAGGTEETWARAGHVKEILNDSVRSGMGVPMIVVMPDASGEDEHHLGKHLGYFSVPGWDYESFFHNELIPAVDANFRTIADKGHRAIAGISMGGEAAVSYAQKYSRYYGTACSISGIVGKPEQSQLKSTDPDYARSLLANNPSAFVKDATAEQVEELKSVRWYADCGDNDYFYEGNIEFFLNMREKGVPIDFRMRSGVHGFYYWITGMPAVLQFVSMGFALQNS